MTNEEKIARFDALTQAAKEFQLTLIETRPNDMETADLEYWAAVLSGSRQGFISRVISLLHDPLS